jgi:sulfane dehydrogenase subunit SoxC
MAVTGRSGRGVGRRGVLAGLALPAALGSARAEEASPPGIPPWTRTQGTDVYASPYGMPSPHEHVVRRSRGVQLVPTAASSNTPLQDLHGIIVPNGLHYTRHHAGVPNVDPDVHRLLVHGAVARPLLFTMDDLVRFPSVSRIHFLECSGNSPLWRADHINPAWTVQDTHGLLSCSEWTGVKLSTVLAEVGADPAATWMLAEGADGAALTRSIPIEAVLDDAILAYAQNGERIRPEQGYPLRLLLPGFEGNTNVKWLRRLKLASAPFETREETSRYTGLLPDGKARQFVFVMEVKSVITRPSAGQTMGPPGFHEIQGLAWSGAGRITQVDVSTDGGAQWQRATLQDPVLPKCLTRFRLPWHWDGQPAQLMSRAVDDTGAVQPTREALIQARGTHSVYHFNGLVGWQVDPHGEIRLAV